MKKTSAALLLILLIAFTSVTWFQVFSGQKDDLAAYNEYLSKAASFEEKGIYVDALENYENALNYDPDNYDIVMKIADMYYQLGDMGGFLDTCDKAIALSSKTPEPYVLKANYYISKAQYTDAIEVVNKAASAIGDSEEIMALRTELSTKCIEKYSSYTYVADWHMQGDENYVAVEENGKWGLVQKDGTREIKLQFEYVGAYDVESGVIPCCFEGDYYYMDLDGNRKLVGDYAYQHLGSFGNGLAPAQRDNLYGYIDTDFTEQHFEFEYAGAFANNIAAVKKAGKWALINNEFEYITDFEYDEILVDSNGFCSMFDIIVVRQGDKYYFIDYDGDRVGDSSFDGAALPADNDSYIAVKRGNKWGFADQKGKMVIDAQYQSAKSFSMGLAPVEIEDRWGFINSEGELVIDTEYFDTGVFSQDGSVPVKNAYCWNFLVLCEYDD